jgi:hypothetical protein
MIFFLSLSILLEKDAFFLLQTARGIKRQNKNQKQTLLFLFLFLGSEKGTKHGITKKRKW